MDQRLTEEALLDGLGVGDKLGGVKAIEIWAAAKSALLAHPNMNGAEIAAVVRSALNDSRLEESVVTAIVDRGKELDPVERAVPTHANGNAPLSAHIRRAAARRVGRPALETAFSSIRSEQPDISAEIVRRYREDMRNSPRTAERKRKALKLLLIAAGLGAVATVGTIVWLLSR